MKKRITYFDLAKGIGIILVVLGHMENISGELRTWISSFHMPLFFVISGMLMAAKGEISILNGDREVGNGAIDVRELVLKAAKGLLIPYFWFSLIYIPIDIMNLYIDNVDKHTFVQNILDSITFSGVSVMWFLPALFIAEAVALVLINTVSKISLGKNSNSKFNTEIVAKYTVLYVAALIISILAYGIWSQMKFIYEAYSSMFGWATFLGLIRAILRGICMNVHVVTGFVMYKLIAYLEELYVDKRTEHANKSYIEMSKEKERKSAKGLCLAGGVIFSVINISLCLKNGAVDNHFLTLNNLFLYYICAFLGSMAIVLICMGFGSVPPIEFLGKNSLIIMATHLQCYILYAGILIAIAIDAYVTRAKSYVYMFNSVLFTMLIEVVIILIINNYFSFITGKGSIKDLFRRSKEK